MMPRLIASCLLMIIFHFTSDAQVIPETGRVDWSKAGFEGAIPKPSQVINVKSFGAYGDSLHDDFNAILTAINSQTGLRVIFFPAGKYLINSTLELPSNVILRGEGENSILYFQLANGAHAILASALAGQPASFTAVTAGLQKGSEVITVNDPQLFTVGSYAEIRQNNGSWYTVPIANYIVGQIVKVVAKNGNQITINAPLRIDYSSNLNPEIRPILPKENIGIECLKISRIDPPTTIYGANIYFSFCANSWVTGVESEKSQAAHILISYSTHISVSGCYIHDAFGYSGDGSSGYGVFLITHSGDCKIENNIFRKLRHAMVTKQGANGNVFGYNYSFEPTRTEFPSDAGGDILLHGHYSFANLFEGNIAQNLVISNTYGSSGPYNTFFRNRLELYGISVSSSTTEKQNFVGNEITNTGTFKGNYSLGSNNFAYSNNVKGIINPAGTLLLNEKSYYLSNTPYYWNNTSAWPGIGTPYSLGAGSNPARDRFLANGSKLSCLTPSPITITTTYTPLLCNNDSTTIVATTSGGFGTLLFSIDSVNYQVSNSFKVSAGSYNIWVKDNYGTSAKSAIIKVNAPLAINISFTKTNVSLCNGGADGSIRVKASGGLLPYKFILNNSQIKTNNFFGKLSPGVYSIKVSDSNQCFSPSLPVTIVKADTFKIFLTKTNVTCKGGSDGTITVNAKGGTPPYRYSLNNGVFQSLNTYYNLKPGWFNVVVKDSRECVSSAFSIRVNQSTIACTPLVITKEKRPIKTESNLELKGVVQFGK